jgi:hypothetical protein
MGTRIMIALFVGCVLSSAARADDNLPEDATRGRLPLWGIAPTGGLLLRGYRTPDSIGALSEYQIDGLFGVTGTLQVELGTHTAIVGETTLSIPGAVLLEANGGLVFGLRHWREYRELQGSSRVSASTVESTYLVYTNRYVPTVLGLYLGAGIYTIGSQVAQTRAVTAPSVMLPALMIPSLELGFGVAGDLGGMIAGVVDPASGSWGGRLRFDGTLGGGSLTLHYGTQMFLMSSPDGIPPLFHLTAYIGLGDGPRVL